ncbi:MAG: T9SS type A sorting domain-containing protein [Bacteroidetes bacterium]|nr:T9SS type A sorting domain-containing protein [Bacteroidota bacterium]
MKKRGPAFSTGLRFEIVSIIYPNPSTDFISVKFDLPEMGNIKISIYDITGKLVLSNPDLSLTTGDQNIQIGTSQLSPASYFLRITSNNEVIGIDRFMVN